MSGLFVLLFLILLAALMFILYRYDRKSKRTKIPPKDLLLGYDFSEGSPWKPSSMTKGPRENRQKVVGESHDQDALEKMFRPPTDEGKDKRDVVTIIVEDDNPEG